MAVYLYVSVRDEDKIVKFTIDMKNGLLKGRKEAAITGGPGPLAIDPTGLIHPIALHWRRTPARIKSTGISSTMKPEN